MDHWLAQCVHHWQVGGVVFDMAEGLLGIVSGVVGTFGLIVGVTVRALDFALGFICSTFISDHCLLDGDVRREGSLGDLEVEA